MIAIDPGTQESAYVLINPVNLYPLEFGKIPNEEMAAMLKRLPLQRHISIVAIEDIESHGMPIGRETLDTVKWIGKFEQILTDNAVPYKEIYRSQEKKMICHSPNAGDSNIRHALIDRFAPGQRNYGKGTKAAPGWFYGFADDIWQAYAVGVTYHDLYVGREPHA